MSRYIERAENIARIVDVNLHFLLDLPEHTVETQWQPLVHITGDAELFKSSYTDFTQDNVMNFLTFDTGYPGSVISSLNRARENARSIREIISSEMWEITNRLYLSVQGISTSSQPFRAPHALFKKIKDESYKFTGAMDATFTRGEGFHFANLGKYMERADKTSRILDVKYFILLPRVEDVGSPFDNIQWMAVLNSTSAYEMYRKKYHTRIEPRLVAEFLLLDREFSRSVRYSLERSEKSLHVISGTQIPYCVNKAERLLGMLRAEFDYQEIDTIIKNGLHEYLDEFQKKLNEIDSAIFDTYFSM